MKDREIERLEGLLAKASAGPWCEDAIRRTLRMASKTAYEPCDQEECDAPGHGNHPGYDDDPAFIAAARTLVPSLLARLRAAESVCEAWDGGFDSTHARTCPAGLSAMNGCTCGLLAFTRALSAWRSTRGGT